ncbi:hypothetical protein D3C85_1484650 [compost metagenome]
MSPLANAPTMVFGITLRTKAMMLWSLPAEMKPAILLVSRVDTSMCMPTPGCTTLTTTRPISKARVDTISKYSSA